MASYQLVNITAIRLELVCGQRLQFGIMHEACEWFEICGRYVIRHWDTVLKGQVFEAVEIRSTWLWHGKTFCGVASFVKLLLLFGVDMN